MQTLDGGRIGIAAQALGIAQAALDASVAASTDSVRASRWRKPTEVAREPDGRTALSTQAGSPWPDSHVHANGLSTMVGRPWS